MKKLILFCLAFLALLVPNVVNAAPGSNAKHFKVGKALHRTCSAIVFPERHPIRFFAGSGTGFLAGLEGVGVAVEAAGLGVQRAGVIIYDVGTVLAGGGFKKPATPAAPTPPTP